MAGDVVLDGALKSKFELPKLLEEFTKVSGCGVVGAVAGTVAGVATALTLNAGAAATTGGVGNVLGAPAIAGATIAVGGGVGYLAKTTCEAVVGTNNSSSSKSPPSPGKK